MSTIDDAVDIDLAGRDELEPLVIGALGGGMLPLLGELRPLCGAVKVDTEADWVIGLATMRGIFVGVVNGRAAGPVGRRLDVDEGCRRAGPPGDPAIGGKALNAPFPCIVDSVRLD